MRSLLAFLLLTTTALSHAIGFVDIGPIGGGGGGGGTDPCAPISVTAYLDQQITFSGSVANGADSVVLEIETASEETVATLTATPGLLGNFSVSWFPPTDSTYTVHATTYFQGLELSCQAVAFVSAVRPDAYGRITGGGWYVSAGGRDTMGFVAQVLGNGTVRGNFEFQDHAGLYNFKSTAVDWVYAPNCSEGFFTGVCKLNGSGSYRFFVHVFDNGEPGNEDSVEFNVYNPANGALLYSYSQSLSHGNVQIHCR